MGRKERQPEGRKPGQRCHDGNTCENAKEMRMRMPSEDPMPKDETPREAAAKGNAVDHKTRVYLSSLSSAVAPSHSLHGHKPGENNHPRIRHIHTLVHTYYTDSCPIILYTPFAVWRRYICIFMCETSPRPRPRPVPSLNPKTESESETKHRPSFEPEADDIDESILNSSFPARWLLRALII